LQYGFTVEGINANPDDEAALGSVVVTPNTLVNADPAAAWGSYMNVFAVSSGAKGGYAFGNGWSLENLKTTFVDAGDDTYANGAITLQPNFNGYQENADDAFWRDNDGAGPGGNAWMEATTRVEYTPGDFTDTSLSFVGTVSSNDLDSEYTAVAFIKTLDPTNNYAPVINETFALGAAGTTFSISASGINPAHVLQYGFTVEGINANPDDEAALGSVVVTPFTSGFEEPAYTLVTADVSKTWKGYVSWFEKNDDGSKGGYVSGDDWTDTNDLKTTFFNTTDGYDNGAIGLQPNFNLYEDAAGDTEAEAVWRDGDVGNKHLEASTFVEYAAGDFTDGALKFVGNIESNNIDNNYEVIAFIKTINATNFLPVITKTVELGAAGTSFEVKATGINSADIVQYGFTVLGLNANPSSEQILGGVVVTPDLTVLSVTDALEAIGFTVYPNPVENTLNVSAGVTVDKVSIFDLTGREVLRATPNAAAFSLDVSSLNKGLYLVTVKAGEQELNTKLVK
jgi:hypothetical protein